VRCTLGFVYWINATKINGALHLKPAGYINGAAHPDICSYQKVCINKGAAHQNLCSF